MDEITYAVADRIATIGLNRPEKLNAMTDEMYATIGEAVREAEADPEVRCIIIGSGRGDQ